MEKPDVNQQPPHGSKRLYGAVLACTGITKEITFCGTECPQIHAKAGAFVLYSLGSSASCQIYCSNSRIGGVILN